MTNEINAHEYKATFDLIDADGDGFIDVGELGNLMRALGKEASTSRVVEVMVAADLSQDGKMTLGEFAAFLQKANL
ncbi:EF-hand domain-containing protein [Actinocorallia sp. A-T 12471]|uniref:EF-hand domain-containing protein n=1 Tax=Actinocorallia sp. A-T 12471 TaxID=3089813 RepID=UPI0029D3DD81|nr:EF-hand domain-containing protein [Actinocorallia sp. A-T 12471]MDX6738659.1 EF-hand domain-containing protein [Actinocorallia sp. A-T 12471]